MDFINDFFKKYVPGLFYRYQSIFSEISDISYIDLEDYQNEIIKVNRELTDIERTIKYYEDRHKILTEWKNILDRKLGDWNSEDTCYNCTHYIKRYCKKHKFNVEPDASCHSFEWK